MVSPDCVVHAKNDVCDLVHVIIILSLTCDYGWMNGLKCGCHHLSAGVLADQMHLPCATSRL